jgi:hypothetical protein
MVFRTQEIESSPWFHDICIITPIMPPGIVAPWLQVNLPNVD